MVCAREIARRGFTNCELSLGYGPKRLIHFGDVLTSRQYDRAAPRRLCLMALICMPIVYGVMQRSADIAGYTHCKGFPTRSKCLVFAIFLGTATYFTHSSKQSMHCIVASSLCRRVRLHALHAMCTFAHPLHSPLSCRETESREGETTTNKKKD